MRSSCLAEWGSTTGRRSWPGAEGGHRSARFFGSGHHGHRAAAENIDQQNTGLPRIPASINPE
ncbi:hypothetical protein [Enterobacter soli]|uniref:hypothetical protein n=1 Tax=Enterobacter soli TaxID=885040 RepID=UPI00030D5B9B|nr:hypothetical protein [Enterobacter soli]